MPVLHNDILGKLGISEEERVEEKHRSQYVRGIDAAVAEVREGDAEVAFILRRRRLRRWLGSRLRVE